MAALAAAMVLLAGCADDGPADGDAASADPSEEAAATTAPADDPALPTRPLQGAAVAVVGDEVWLVGGSAGYDPYEANPLVIRRSADGSILGTTPLDLGDDEIVQAASPPATVDGTTYLVGLRCTFQPDAENGACAEGEPVVHRVDADGLVALDVPPSWGTGAANTPGSFGYPPWVVGTVDDRIVTAEVVGEGPIATVTEEVAVALYDPVAGTVAPVPTVPGVVTGSSVCADGGAIYSLAPALTAEQRVAGADIWAQDDPVGAPDAPPRKVATITLDDPQQLTSGGLTCGDGFVVVTGSGGGGIFVVVDTATGAVGDISGGDEWGRSLRVPPGGDGSRLVLTSWGTGSGTQTVTHRLVTADGVTDLPDGGTYEEQIGIPAPREVVEVDGRLLDVGAWLHEPDVEQPAIALT